MSTLGNEATSTTVEPVADEESAGNDWLAPSAEIGDPVGSEQSVVDNAADMARDAGEQTNIVFGGPKREAFVWLAGAKVRHLGCKKAIGA